VVCPLEVSLFAEIRDVQELSAGSEKWAALRDGETRSVQQQVVLSFKLINKPVAPSSSIEYPDIDQLISLSNLNELIATDPCSLSYNDRMVYTGGEDRCLGHVVAESL